MTQEEILEYNKRCALFCTSEPEVLKRDLEKAGTLECMEYHSDWNWIMEVKSKICQIKEVDEFDTRYDSVAKGFYCSISPSYKNTFESFYTKVLTNEKEAVIDVINQFLIWYEENKS